MRTTICLSDMPVQFVTVFRALRLSQFFLLRARLNCSNKQFYVKRKTRVPSGQPGMCHRASKQVIPSFFGGRPKPDWIVFPYHVSYPCLHFVFTSRHLPSPVPVCAGAYLRGLPALADFVKTLRACGRQGGTDGSYENYGRQQRHRAHCLRSVGNGSHLPHHPLVRHGRSYGPDGRQGCQKPARPDRERA